MKYDDVALYYMSGTGNTYRASQWIADEARAQGAEVVLEPIERAEPAEQITPGPDQLIGLLMPTHGFTAPWYMIKFAARLPRGEGTHAFCLATRAGMKLGPLVTPGISGSATLLIALLLLIRGYAVRGATALEMPSNWLQVHPGFSEKSARFILGKMKPRALRFARRVFDGRRCWPPVNTTYDVVQSIIWFPVVLGYLAYGRMFFAKMFHANNRCNGCGLCVSYCPCQGVELRGGPERPLPFWTFHCESCNRCVAFCAQRAIETSYSWTVAATVLAVPFVLPLFGWPPALSRWVFGSTAALLAWGALVIASWYFLLFPAYALFIRAIRNRRINDLFTYTNLTHLYRRYKEPDTRLKQIGRYKKARGVKEQAREQE